MAQQIQAWKSKSGKIFLTRQEAMQDDVREEFLAAYGQRGLPGITAEGMLEWLGRNQRIVGKWIHTFQSEDKLKPIIQDN